ncbi:hypothetical protein BJ138DRAFT_1138264 [Hygrophoropsis aurantiaca]|uniref:Uncharacterized protein n=1 Tax=Hygrophoropsis aurantiaca TaxID=72124 RepID=A0ACB7ZWK9_9AGAM|nr:hypothetical protein BJ138DRAFT_1138264 [Hygrophoropsis aurantiaca]
MAHPDDIRNTPWRSINTQLGTSDKDKWEDADADATHLTTLGETQLWPVYLYFGNESKYRQCKPSCNLSNHVPYFQKLPASFKDFICEHTNGKGASCGCTTHCQRELFQAQWEVLLDTDFLEAYEHGPVIQCCDGIRCRFYPQIFTYSVDYPEKILIATIRQLGGCPCPRCLVPMSQVAQLGCSSDRRQRIASQRSDSSRQRLVNTARSLIYNNFYGVDSTPIENLLKAQSWVPNSNIFSDRLAIFGFNVGLALLTHLLRILYRLVPMFGQSTIQRFKANTSELKNMAARNFEDLLQCAIPVFDGLLPHPQNAHVVQLLFTMAHWHGLAKLRMHSDLTLEILDTLTTMLGDQFRKFDTEVCSLYNTKEFDHEMNARTCRQAKAASHRTNNTNEKTQTSTGPSKANDANQPTVGKNQCREVKFNLKTYKFHALGDYVTCIRNFGTSDSYSTESGELEHCTGKARYDCTDRKTFVRQLMQIERRQARIRCIKNRLQKDSISSEVDAMATDPRVHHFIGRSEKLYKDVGHFLRSHAGDPAIQNYLPHLKSHLLQRKISKAGDSQSGHLLANDINQVLFQCNRIYKHNIARFNYTTYDVRRAQDVINPRTDHCNIMVLNDIDKEGSHYRYAKVLGIHHVNAVFVGCKYDTRHMDFLFAQTLDRIHFKPLHNVDAFGFINPDDVLRCVHIIPAFHRGMSHNDRVGMSPLAGDGADWHEYTINCFVDRDTLMRYHFGLGVGHVYSHIPSGPAFQSPAPRHTCNEPHVSSLPSQEDNGDQGFDSFDDDLDQMFAYHEDDNEP